MSRFSAFVGSSEWLNDTMRLNRAFWMAIDNISEWSYSCAMPVWCGYESIGFHGVKILAGNSVGLFSSIESAGVILRRIVEEAEAILNKRPSELLAR